MSSPTCSWLAITRFRIVDIEAVSALAQDWQVPFHTHIVETKVQGVTGPEVSDLNAVPGKGLPAGGLDGTNTLLQRVGRAVV